MSSEHLYIIGNGFDCYHGAKCSYGDFRRYLLRHRPEVLATFDLYFGSKSLYNSFDSIDDSLKCFEISTGCTGIIRRQLGQKKTCGIVLKSIWRT